MPPAVPVKRTITLMAFPVIALYGVMQSVNQILLPNLVAAINPENKVSIIANISLIAGIMGTLAIVIGPAISDRSRSRFGKRAPYLAALSLLTCVIMALIAQTSSTVMIIALMAVFGMSTNWYSGCIYAILPDRIPESHRGTASSVLGLGLPIGILIFVNYASRVPSTIGYITIGIAFVATTALFLIDSPEPSSLDTPKPERKKESRGFSLNFFDSFRHWNFTMTFLSRFTFYLGFFAISSYTMYIITDYIGSQNVPGGNASVAVATLSTISTIFQVIAVLTCGFIADKFDPTKTIVGIAGFAMVFAYICPILMPSWIGMIAFNIIAGAAGGVYFSVDAALMSRVLPTKGHEGRDMGILNAASSVTSMFAALIGSMLLSAFSTYAAIFFFGAILAATCGICTISIRNIR